MPTNPNSAYAYQNQQVSLGAAVKPKKPRVMPVTGRHDRIGPPVTPAGWKPGNIGPQITGGASRVTTASPFDLSIGSRPLASMGMAEGRPPVTGQPPSLARATLPASGPSVANTPVPPAPRMTGQPPPLNPTVPNNVKSLLETLAPEGRQRWQDMADASGRRQTGIVTGEAPYDATTAPEPTYAPPIGPSPPLRVPTIAVGNKFPGARGPMVRTPFSESPTAAGTPPLPAGIGAQDAVNAGRNDASTLTGAMRQGNWQSASRMLQQQRSSEAQAAAGQRAQMTAGLREQAGIPTQTTDRYGGAPRALPPISMRDQIAAAAGIPVPKGFVDNGERTAPVVVGGLGHRILRPTDEQRSKDEQLVNQQRARDEYRKNMATPEQKARMNAQRAGRDNPLWQQAHEERLADRKAGRLERELQGRQDYADRHYRMSGGPQKEMLNRFMMMRNPGLAIANMQLQQSEREYQRGEAGEQRRHDERMTELRGRNRMTPMERLGAIEAYKNQGYPEDVARRMVDSAVAGMPGEENIPGSTGVPGTPGVSRTESGGKPMYKPGDPIPDNLIITANSAKESGDPTAFAAEAKRLGYDPAYVDSMWRTITGNPTSSVESPGGPSLMGALGSWAGELFGAPLGGRARTNRKFRDWWNNPGNQ